jgi:outer membrane biosynthesis protein TonB
MPVLPVLLVLGGMAAGLLASEADKPAGAAQDAPQPTPQVTPQSPPQTDPQTAPQTAPQTQRVPGGRRAMAVQRMKEMGLDPNHQRVRYEMGSFMITGSLEIDPRVYDGKPVIDAWMKKVEELWKPKLPLAAKMGNSGRTTFKGVLMRDKGIASVEKIEPSGLETLDEAASQAMEEFKSSFVIPPDFPADYVVFYMKFHYNIFSEY